ncbi:unnamed protein product [Caenorhabditis nigoni]
MQFFTFSLLIFFICYANCAPKAGDCTPDDLKECTPLGNKLKAYMSRHEGYRLPPDVYQNCTILCGSITKCYNELKCNNAQELKEDFEIRCSKLEYLTASIHHCMNRFSNAVYQRTYECSKKYDFLTRDLTKKAQIYKDGQACFVEIAEKVCRAESVEYLKNKETYGKLVNFLTVKPDNGCRGPHHEFSSEQCKPVVNSLNDLKVDLEKVQINDPTLLKLIGRCKEAVACVNDACMYPMAQDIHDGCDVFQLVNTHYGRCLVNVGEKDLSKYACLEGKLIVDKNECLKADKKDCLKIVFEGECGKEAVKNFDEHFETHRRTTCRRASLVPK